MTHHPVTVAFGEGIHAEQALTEQRAHWTREKWVQHKRNLHDWIHEEDNELIRARAHGRLLVVCIEGWRRFGS